MKVGLIDVDGHNFPNLALMKISAYHKKSGDSVEWYLPFGERYDIVYMSKVFSFSPDVEECINADKVVRGGTGYMITLVGGREALGPGPDSPLPPEIECQYPDYSIYPHLTGDTAFGFLTRGCPRGCDFCIVGSKEGLHSRKVADLDYFWNGQKRIVLLDPNILACADWKDLLQQLIDSRAGVDFSQGLDIRLITEEKIDMLNRIRLSNIHFAWDRYGDRDAVLPKLELYARLAKRKVHGNFDTVYTIANFDTTIEQDLDRIYTLREMGYYPYVMVYDKEHADNIYYRLQQWCNNPWVFRSCSRFEDYDSRIKGRQAEVVTSKLF